MIRCYGSVERDRSYQLRPGAYAVLRRRNAVLLTHQQEPVPETQLPGGGIDPGESPLTALHREVLEETGWSITNLRRLGAYRKFIFMPEYDIWAEKICHVYFGRPAICHGPPTESGHTALWVPKNIAPEMLDDEASRDFLSRT